MKARIILIPDVYGFCGGVKSAISILQNAVKQCKPPIYAYHEIVHNEYVVDMFKRKGVIFVKDISEIKSNKNPVILSAHGSSKNFIQALQERNIKYTDTVCSKVKIVHDLVVQKDKEGFDIILIGTSLKHQEVVGTMSYSKNIHFVSSIEDVQNLPNLQKPFYVTQTTLSIQDTQTIIDKIRERFYNATGNNNICLATTKRQKAVEDLINSNKLDCFIVVGSSTSSNAGKLLRIAQKNVKNVFLISDKSQLKTYNIYQFKTIGMTASASTSQEQFDEIFKLLNL